MLAVGGGTLARMESGNEIGDVAMGGSFSIKSVLPAICPDDPALDHHALKGVHKDSEAMSFFLKLQFTPEAEKEEARKNLLKYCELDTLAMVKVWEELVRVGE